jgi:hypothetical protein
VLERNGSGSLWTAVVRDPNHDAIDTLRSAENISELELQPLTLEEAYMALAARAEGGAR